MSRGAGRGFVTGRALTLARPRTTIMNYFLYVSKRLNRQSIDGGGGTLAGTISNAKGRSPDRINGRRRPLDPVQAVPDGIDLAVEVAEPCVGPVQLETIDSPSLAVPTLAQLPHRLLALGDLAVEAPTGANGAGEAILTMTSTPKSHSVVPVQPRNLAFTFCAVCHQLLARTS